MGKDIAEKRMQTGLMLNTPRRTSISSKALSLVVSVRHKNMKEILGVTTRSMRIEDGCADTTSSKVPNLLLSKWPPEFVLVGS